MAGTSLWPEPATQASDLKAVTVGPLNGDFKACLLGGSGLGKESYIFRKPDAALQTQVTPAWADGPRVPTWSVHSEHEDLYLPHCHLFFLVSYTYHSWSSGENRYGETKRPRALHGKDLPPTCGPVRSGT